MNQKQQKRLNALLPLGIPRYVRIYDNVNYGDRYTVVFTGRYNGMSNGAFLSMSSMPCSPLGIGLHGESKAGAIDRPSYGHLGKKISWADLPKECQDLALHTYKNLWDL